MCGVTARCMRGSSSAGKIERVHVDEQIVRERMLRDQERSYLERHNVALYVIFFLFNRI